MSSPRALVLVLALSACAPSADDPLSQLDTAGPLTGEYQLHYLAPPWELVSSEGTTTLIRVQSNGMLSGVAAAPPKYELTATVEPGTPDARIAADAASAPSRGEMTVAGPRPVMNDTGIFGQELLTRETTPIERHYRYVYFPLGAQVVRLYIESTPSLDTPETDEMIGHVVIGP
jgi:hypothetical protein